MMAKSTRFDLGEPIEDDLGLELFTPKPVARVSPASRPATQQTAEAMGFVREDNRAAPTIAKAAKGRAGQVAPSKTPSMIKVGRKSSQRDTGPRAQITLSGSAQTLQRFIDRADREGLTYVELIDALLDQADGRRLSS
jgi:hypothetical protein